MEVFKIAIYHFEAKMISRGTGRSVVAAAAYASCSQIYNDYDGVMHNYTKKSGLLHSEVILPSNAPAAWQDRAELWNAVEAAEKSKDNQLARELIVALPVELRLDEWKTMLCDFLSEQCVDKGMCADYSIHDTDGHNPHAHILLTVRPLDNKGKWQAKTQKEYLCKCGDEERGFTSEEFKTAQADGWEKQYQYCIGKKKVYMTPSEAAANNYERVNKYPKSTRYGRQNPICAEWNSEEQLLKWRKAWETAVNKALENNNISKPIDCHSFKERGIDEQPTIHEGVTARIIEQRGGVSDRCEINRQIRADNALVRELKALIKELIEKVKKSIPNIAAALEDIRGRLLLINYQLRFNIKQLKQIEVERSIIPTLLKRYKKISADLKDKISTKKKLQVEKKACPSINIVKHTKLSKQLTAVTGDIEELKFQEKSVLDDLSCVDEKQVYTVERNFRHNLYVAEQLNLKNTELKQECEAEKSQYIKIRDNIPPENLETVQVECIAIRAANRRKTHETLQETYGYRYSGDIFKDAENAVNAELNEKPVKQSLRRRLRQKQHETAFHHSTQKRNYEYER
ncbi:MAG: MobQ family relaxase [bacterium]|nr:MobQ family relaxase [bacterium]